MEQFLNPHEYMLKFDIKQGYHHVDIHKPYQNFLVFHGRLGAGNLLFCIYCPPIWTNVSTVYIYKSYEMSRKTLENKCDQNSLLSWRWFRSCKVILNDFISFEFCEKVFRENAPLETVSKFDLVRNKNKLKKRFLLCTNGKTVSYKNLDCITH